MLDTLGVDDLIERAAKAGYPLTRSQLKRLRLNGLVGTPKQRHRVGLAGSESVYGESDAERLLGVLKLRHEHGLETFLELRVGAWLQGLKVDIEQLRPDVVTVLRSSLEGHQGLERGNEDDHVSRRLKTDFRGGSAEIAIVNHLMQEDAFGLPSFEDFALALLQLALKTEQRNLSRARFDHQVRLSTDRANDVSDLYEQWEMPPTSQWPRIVSRSSSTAFEFGQTWLAIIRHLVTQTDLFQQLAASPLTTEIIDYQEQNLLDESGATLEMRTQTACVGIVLRHSAPRELFRKLIEPEE